MGHAKNPMDRELKFYKTMAKYLSSAHSAKEKKQTKQTKTKEEQIKSLINKVEDTVIEKTRPRVIKQIIDLAKPTLASRRIGKFVRRTVVWNVIDNKEAFIKKVRQITLKPQTIGNAQAQDILSLLASSYLKARRLIPRDATFRIWASCEFDAIDPALGDGGMFHVTKTSTSFDSNQMDKFFKDFSVRFALKYFEYIILKSLKITYNFAIIPKGAGYIK